MPAKYFKASVFLVLLTILTSLTSYLFLPEKIPIHFDINSEPDNYSNKTAYITIFSGIAIGILLMFYLIPRINPRNVYTKFKKEYFIFLFVFLAFNYYIELIIIAYSFGLKLRIDAMLAFAFAVLFFFIGKLLKKTEKNYFVGVRTPWTLKDNTTWKNINTLAGKYLVFSSLAMFLSGALSILTGFNSFFALIFFTVVPPTILATHSYFLYKKKA